MMRKTPESKHSISSAASEEYKRQVITGEGELIVDEKTYPLTMGTSFILPNQIERWEIKGELKLIASEPGK